MANQKLNNILRFPFIIPKINFSQNTQIFTEFFIHFFTQIPLRLIDFTESKTSFFWKPIFKDSLNQIFKFY
jgi:hypothetical protein